MRLEANTYAAWPIQAVWHCEEMRRVLCRWVDDETMQYGEWVAHDLITRQAKKIVITRTVVYINPVEGSEIEIREEQLEIA